MATLFSSCGNDFLEPEPTGAISESTFYSNESELITGLINMYDGIQGTNALEDSSSELLQGIQFEFYLTEMRSDNTRTKSSEGEAAQFENYSISTSNGIVTDYYQSFYQIIYRANVVLKNIGVATPANAAKIEAEARFVRAYAYFNLVRLFGDVPLINEVIAPLDLEKQFTRVATSTIYDSIIDDLVFASTHLDNTYKNRASKAAAQSLLAKVYLTTKNYSAAQVLCEAVINSGFTLQNNFNDVFYKEGNSEIIFAIGYTNSPASESQGFSAEWLNSIGRSSGVNYVTPEAAAALDELGGNRAAFSYRMDPAQPTQRQVAKYFPNGENGGPTGVAFDLNPDFAGNDWIVLRFADVLLMHVEAIMAGGASTNATAALTSFQKIRDRAGLTATVTNITKQQLLDERRVELAFENQRLFDLMRFGEAQNVLSAFSTANNYSFTATDLLLPIPQREINLSKGLMSQNPGY
jgi:hypothetical protein